MKAVTDPTNQTNNAPAGSLADMVNKVGNANVNYKSGAHAMAGGIKSEAMGKDTGPDATNSMKVDYKKENGPSATCAGSGYMQRGKKG
jgi:hypothetical protein